MSSEVAIPTLHEVGADQAPFKRLKMTHRRVIALHIQGHSGAAIDRVLDKGAGYANRVLKNPTVQDVLADMYSAYDRELKALYPKTIDAMRSALEDGSHADALRAADLWHKVNGTYKDEQTRENSAEDIARILIERRHPDGTEERISAPLQTARILNLHQENTPDEDSTSTLDVDPISSTPLQ